MGTPDRHVVVACAALLGRGCHLDGEAPGVEHDGGVCQEIVNEVTRHPQPGRYDDI